MEVESKLFLGGIIVFVIVIVVVCERVNFEFVYWNQF